MKKFIIEKGKLVMKKLLLLLLVVMPSAYSYAAPASDVMGVGLDFAINSNGACDFGMSIGITSPWFFQNHFAFKSNGGISFNKVDA